MILFFGTREVVQNNPQGPGGGPRQCPHCGQVALFTPRTSRNYIHVFWLPIIPIGKERPIIECNNCKARFHANYGF
jgi:hypothetical protein